MRVDEEHPEVTVRAMRALASLLLLTATMSQAQQTWTNKVTDTPSLVQTDFGAYGSKLPFNGEISCGETAIAMNMLWLARNGFTQLTTDSRDPAVVQAAGENLIQIFQGMLNGAPNSTPENGSYYTYMIDTFLSLQGIDSSLVTIEHMYAPSLSWINEHIQGGSVVNVQAGWYAVDGDALNRNGQHWWTPLAVDEANSALTINNPYPASYLQVPNLPSSNPQNLPLIPLTPEELANTNPLLAGGPYLQINTPIINTEAGTLAILEAGWSFTIHPNAMPSSGNYEIKDFVISDSRYINVGDGVLDAIARITGTGGIFKLGDGKLILHAENISSGYNTLSEGTIVSRTTHTTPLGTGSIEMLRDAEIFLEPNDTTPAAIVQTLASGANSRLTYGGGNVLVLTLGNNTSQSVTIGGYTDDATANLAQNGNGTFVIAPSGGLAALGSTQKVLVAGAAGNQPVNTNGAVSPTLIGQDNDGHRSGRFLQYDATNGFQEADGTLASGGTAISSSTAQTVYIADTAQTIGAGDTAAAYLLELRGADVTGAAGSKLQLGSQLSNTQTGVILNGATLAVPEIEFGQGDLYVYTNEQNGTINGNLNGSGAVVFFGPGTTTLAATSAYTGGTHVNTGTLVVANTTPGNATGSGTVTVNDDANLIVNTGGSTGAVSAQTNGVLTLNGGSVGAVTTVAGDYQSQNGGIIEGHGTIRGAATLSGTIRAGSTPGRIVFEDSVDLQGGFVEWRLNALDDAASNEGIHWNSFEFQSTNTTFGAQDNPFFLLLSFDNIADPDSGDAFWNESHQWLFAKLPEGGIDWWQWDGGDVTYDAGTFGLNTIEGSGDIYMIYTPNPVPEPSTVLLGLLGIAALALARRGRKA